MPRVRTLLSLLILCALVRPTVPLRAGPPTDVRGTERAGRRAYAGAPPVIPHGLLGMDCLQCHGALAVNLPTRGLSPASPHALTRGMGSAARCVQCHVYRQTDGEFRTSSIVGLAPLARPGARAHAFAPPTIPHRLFMRENCVACHAGERAAAAIRTRHPERTRCQQCHVPVLISKEFARHP